MDRYNHEMLLIKKVHHCTTCRESLSLTTKLIHYQFLQLGEGRVTATTHNELEIKEMFIGSKGITEASEEVTEVIETGEEVSGQEVTEGHSVDLTVVPDE